MSKKKQPVTPKISVLPPAEDPIDRRYKVLLWLIFFAGSLFFIPQCLDRFLISRFFFTSVVLLASVAWLWQHWRDRTDWRLNGFDLLLLAWYGMNILSVSWSFSWSEGVFYAQKVLLLFGVYWLVRNALLHNETLTRHTLAYIIRALTLVVSIILSVQVGMAVMDHGLDNQHLYDYASGVFGNKGLASDFLFFLLIFNFLFKNEFKRKTLFWASAGVLFLLLLILQTRTVYLATTAALMVYFPFRALLEPGFRFVFFRKILPLSIAGVGILIAVLSWRGHGSTLAERLNPATYLESASALERRFVWHKTEIQNKEHYWWGVGNGSWKIWFPSKSIEGGYRLQEKNIVFTRVHNDYLEIRAELGLIGLLLFISLFVAAFVAAAFALRRTADERQRHELLTLLAGLTGYCVIQYFDFPRERIEMQAILGLLFAYLAWCSRTVWASLPGLPVRRYSVPLLWLLLAGFVFNIVMGWQRIKGEIHTVDLLKAQARGDFPTLQREAAAARNIFYEYNDVTIPLQWFEGIGFYQMNRIEESIAAFESAYRLNPWSFQVINNYATALLRAGRHNDAIPLFENALAINPKYDEGKFNLAYAWFTMGDRDKAMAWLARVDTIPNPPTDDERQKNRATLAKKAEFIKAIGKEQ